MKLRSALLITLLAAATACSDDKPATTPTAPPASKAPAANVPASNAPTGSTSVSPSAAPAAPSGGLPDPCSLATTEQVAAVLPGAGPGVRKTANQASASCDWTSGDARLAIVTQLMPAGLASHAAEAMRASAKDDGDTLLELGDAAIASDQHAALIKGAVQVQVLLIKGTADVAKMTELLKQIAARL